MAKISLKNIFGKSNDASAIILSLAKQFNSTILVEDISGKILVSTAIADHQFQYPILFENEICGWVKGDENGIAFAELIISFVAKRSRKKKVRQRGVEFIPGDKPHL